MTDDEFREMLLGAPPRRAYSFNEIKRQMVSFRGLDLNPDPLFVSIDLDEVDGVIEGHGVEVVPEERRIA